MRNAIKSNLINILYCSGFKHKQQQLNFGEGDKKMCSMDTNISELKEFNKWKYLKFISAETCKLLIVKSYFRNTSNIIRISSPYDGNVS